MHPWVTHLNDGVRVQLTGHLAMNDAQRQAGVNGDQLVLLGSGSDRMAARIIHYHHRPTGRLFRFATNHLHLGPTTIAKIYMCGWDIEQLFKRVQQNYPLRCFPGDSPDAIKIRIWCTVIADLIRIHLHTHIDAVRFLRDPDWA